MRILHTSDWHVGKRLMGRERLDEQAQVLDEIADVCDKYDVELVLVAGDVFDTYTPSADAEELFYAKVKKVAGKDRAVLIISGNHDDGVRLSSIAPFSEDQGVYVVGNARTPISVKESVRGVDRDITVFNPGSLGDFEGSFGNLSVSDNGFLLSHGKYHNIK